MKRIYLNTIFSFLSFVSFSQTNLVPNPSFEDTLHCPMSSGLISYAKYWFSADIATPDYFNAYCYYSLPYTPWNSFQYPRTGNAMAGIIVYSIMPGDSLYREYIEIGLTSQLKSGKKYCVEFYANLANDSKYASNRLGLCFSSDSILKNTSDTISRIPVIYDPLNNIITDTLNWIKISGDYIANGGERFITIGCFYPNDSITYQLINPGSLDLYDYAYYFIDDISVYLCEDSLSMENQITIPNAFTPNGDGINEIFKPHGQNIKSINGKIFNRWGQELFKWNDLNSGWDGKHNGQDVSAGVYFYVIEVTFEDGEIQEKHGSIEVIR
jgi:gliding motility-associated-like protein